MSQHVDWLSSIPTDDLEILWAFLIAGVEDCHAPQDLLSEHQWQRAEAIVADMTKRIESR